MATSTLSLRRRLVTILPDWGSFLGSFYRDTGKNYDHDRADHNDTYGDVRDLYFGGHGSANRGQVQLTAVYGTWPRLRLLYLPPASFIVPAPGFVSHCAGWALQILSHKMKSTIFAALGTPHTFQEKSLQLFSLI